MLSRFVLEVLYIPYSEIKALQRQLKSKSGLSFELVDPYKNYERGRRNEAGEMLE